MPLACLPVQIAGRNRMTREMMMSEIRSDPAYMNGDYKTEPMQGLTDAIDIAILMSSSPLQMMKRAPTRDGADAMLTRYRAAELEGTDANDFVYQFNASRNYDPSAKLDTITVPVMWVNSADDFINPPELGIAEKMVTRLKHGTFVLIPISDATIGHGTHTKAVVWQQYLKTLLDESSKTSH
jgi:homoserine O-acetyltransferase/O-succinyltransferase